MHGRQLTVLDERISKIFSFGTKVVYIYKNRRAEDVGQNLHV